MPTPPSDADSPAHSLARWRWAGMVGSVLVAVGGLGAGALPRPDPWTDVPVLRVLRHGAGPGVCLALAAIGMTLLVVSWWRLQPGTNGRVVSAGWLTRTAAWWAVPLALAPPLFSRDLYIYAAQGLVLARGLDPYQVGPAAITSGPGADWLTSVSPTWAATPAPYGPLFLLFSGAIADRADGHLLVAVGALRVLAVLGVAALAALTPRLAAGYGADPARAQWLVAANPLLLAHLIGGGHNEALMLPLLAGCLLAASRCRSADRTRRVLASGACAGALGGLAAAVKISVVVALPFVALLVAAGLPVAAGLVARWWRLVRAGAVVLAASTVAFTLVSAVAGLGPGFVHALGVTGGTSVQWTSVPTGWGLAAGWLTEADNTVLDVARTVGTVLTVLVLVGLWWLVRQPPERGAPERYPTTVVATCGVALVAVVVLGTAVHPWYLVWSLVPLAAVAGLSGPRWAGRVALGLAWASTALCFLVLPDGYNLARSTVVPGALFDVALTIAAGWLGVRWLRRTRQRRATDPVTDVPKPAATTGAGR